MRRVWALLLVQLAAGWPSWRWWASRVQDGSDEPWGLAALVLLAALLVRPLRHAPSAAHLWALALANLALALAGPQLPPLVRAAGLLLCVTSLLARGAYGRAFHPGTWLLALLSLPLLSSLQFFLGYPLRLLSASLGVPLLRLMGLPAVREGLMLQVGEVLVQVDAPCSGARMLWVGLLLAASLAWALQLGTRGTAATLALALGAVVAGNALRVCALTLLEVQQPGGPAWLHSGVGLATFVPVVLAVAVAAHRQQPAGRHP
jgi:exosortase/archaeosortase family protein